MAKIIDFQSRKKDSEGWNEDIEDLEMWVYHTVVAMTRIGTNRTYTNEQMLDCICALTGLHKRIARQAATGEVFKRWEECPSK